MDDMEQMTQRASLAQAKAAQAYSRLLRLAEERDSGQIVRVAKFLAATFNGSAFPFDVYELRAVDIEISDDMLACLDALRWAKTDLHNLVPDGEERMLAMIQAWGLKWPDVDG